MSGYVLTAREFDTIDAFHTMDGGEHSLACLGLRMGVTLACIEKRIDRMRRRGLIDAREIPQRGGRKRYILARVSEHGERAFQMDYAMMAVAS